MNYSEILELTRAGFTKEEILAMEAAGSTNPEGQKKEEPKKEEPEPKKVEEPIAKDNPPAPENIILSKEQLQQLIQGVAVQTASGKIETPPTVNERLADRLTSLMKGE